MYMYIPSFWIHPGFFFFDQIIAATKLFWKTARPQLGTVLWYIAPILGSYIIYRPQFGTIYNIKAPNWGYIYCLNEKSVFFIKFLVRKWVTNPKEWAHLDSNWCPEEYQWITIQMCYLGQKDWMCVQYKK